MVQQGRSSGRSETKSVSKGVETENPPKRSRNRKIEHLQPEDPTNAILKLYSRLRESEKRISALKLQDIERKNEALFFSHANIVVFQESELAEARSQLQANNALAKENTVLFEKRIKEYQAETESAQKALSELQNEFQSYKQEFNEGTQGPSPSTLDEAINAEVKKKTKAIKDLEASHVKALAETNKKHKDALKDMEETHKKNMKEEIEKAIRELTAKQKKADIAKAQENDQEENEENMKLKETVEKLTRQLDDTKATLAKAREASPVKNGADAKLRAELAEAKMQLSKKSSQIDKVEAELKHLREELETSKKASENKAKTLKSKINTLETQLEKRELKSKTSKVKKLSRAPASIVSTPVNEPKTRFDQDVTVNESMAIGKQPSVSTFSTTPFLSRTSLLQAPSTPKITGSPSRPEPGAQSPPRQAKKNVFHLSPVRKNAKASTAAGEPTKKNFAVNKATGKKVSLFDDDSDDERGDDTLTKPQAKKTITKKISTSSFLDDASIMGEEPKKRKKRKLNANVKLDLYEDSQDESNDNHPDKPGSMFKRAKPAVLASASSAAPTGATKKPAKKLGDNPATLGPPTSTESASSGGLFGRDISPLKARNKGIRKIFKV